MGALPQALAQPDLPFFKIGRAVRYRCADVLAFLEVPRGEHADGASNQAGDAAGRDSR